MDFNKTADGVEIHLEHNEALLLCNCFQELLIDYTTPPGDLPENLEAVWAAVPHAVRKLQGDPEDCAPQRKP